MSINLLPTPLPDAIALLHQTVDALLAGKRQRPSATEVVNALLTVEDAARHTSPPIALEKLQGQWRLAFTTGVRKQRGGGIALGKGFYVPQFAPAHISFAPTHDGITPATIRNQVKLGPLRLCFTGPYRLAGKKNLVAFDFTQLQLQVGDRPLFCRSIRGGKPNAPTFQQQSIAKLPFFAFFWVTEQAIAARGRGGGLALWIRDDPH